MRQITNITLAMLIAGMASGCASMAVGSAVTGVVGAGFGAAKTAGGWVVDGTAATYRAGSKLVTGSGAPPEAQSSGAFEKNQ